MPTQSLPQGDSTTGPRYDSRMFTSKGLVGCFTVFTLVAACQESAPERRSSPVMLDASSIGDSDDDASSRDASVPPTDAEPSSGERDEDDDGVPPMARPDAMPTSSDCEPGTGWNGESCAPCIGLTFSDGSHACRRWTNCPAGSFATTEPDSTRDRTCERCPEGTLSFGVNQDHCPELETFPSDVEFRGRGISCTFTPSTHSVNCAAYPVPQVEFSDFDGKESYFCGLEAGTGLTLCWGRTHTGTVCDVAPAAPPEVFTEIAVGTYGGCGITPEKQTVCWWDQLSVLQAAGLLAECDRESLECPEVLEPIPPPPSGVEFEELSVGDLFACGIVRGDSHVECWGVAAPLPPENVAFESLDVGFGYGCGVRKDNSQVECWGDNTQGQAAPPSGIPFDRVQVAKGAACGLRAESLDAVCWGQLPSGPPGVAFSSLQVSDTRACGYALLGGAWTCWYATGEMTVSGLPISALTDFCTLRAQDQRAACHNDDSPDVAFSAITEGRFHTCGILADDSTALCWGDDEFGQASPPSGVPFLKLSAGESFTCGIRAEDSRVECWGLDEKGRLNPPAYAYSELSVGRYHACAIRVSDAKMDCWGSYSGGAGRAPAGNFERVSAGNGETCGIELGTGQLRCWGGWEVAVPPEGAFIEVDVGWASACGIRAEDRFAECWVDSDEYLEHSGSRPLSAISYRGCGIDEQDGFPYCWEYENPVYRLDYDYDYDYEDEDEDTEDDHCSSDAQRAVSEHLEQGACAPATADATIDVREARVEYCHLLERCVPEALVNYAGGNVQGCLDYERCSEVFPGTVTQECVDALASAECDQYFAVFNSPLCTLGGQTLQPRTAGQSCWTSVCRAGPLPTESIGCDEGLYCNEDDICTPRVEAGQPCSVNPIDPCEPGTYCNVGEGRCSPWLAPGQACEASGVDGGAVAQRCEFGPCEDGVCPSPPVLDRVDPGLGLGEPCTPGDCLRGLGCDANRVCSPLQCGDGP